MKRRTEEMERRLRIRMNRWDDLNHKRQQREEKLIGERLTRLRDRYEERLGREEKDAEEDTTRHARMREQMTFDYQRTWDEAVIEQMTQQVAANPWKPGPRRAFIDSTGTFGKADKPTLKPTTAGTGLRARQQEVDARDYELSGI